MTTTTDPLLEGLNERQFEAVTTTLDQPTLVIAGAGSGKTGVLTRRAAYIIRERCGPEHQMIVTFTNKAAKEMKERIVKYAGQQAADKITMGTFHSIAVRILRRHGASIGVHNRFSIFDTDDQKQLMRDALRQHGFNTDAAAVRSFLGKISDLKNNLLTPENFREQMTRQPRHEPGDLITYKVYKTYQELLDKHRALDFDDLIMKTVHLLNVDPDVRKYYQDRYKYVMVDEYQDTNPAQYKMIRLIAGNNNVFVVGDDYQSIYGFRGSDLSIILNFEQDYPGCKVVKLEQNYRSTKTVVHAGNMLMKKNKGQKDKFLFTENDQGGKLKLYNAKDGEDEAKYVVRQIQTIAKMQNRPFKDFAVLYRQNFLSQEIEKELNRQGIAYNVVGGVSFYERMEIKDMLAYMRVVSNPRDDVAMKRVLGIAPGIGKTTIQAIEDLAEGSNVPIVAALKNFTSNRKQIMDSLDSLRALLNELHRYYQLGKAVSDKPVSEMLEITLRKTNYRDNLLNKKDEDSLARVENLDELLKVMEEYEASTEEPNMTEFLEGAALASGKDEESREQQVNLMTMHASKGLEFPVVFLVGWEQGIFPSQRAITPEDLEEERRLAYVGITRAESDVHISNARKRMMHRQLLFNAPSQFIDDIPKEVLTKA